MNIDDNASRINQMILDSHAGDSEAFATLFAAVYSSLKRVARARLSEENGVVTLSTTGLLNETYLKLLSGERPLIKDRGHLLGVSSKAMRQVLIDYARRRNAAKRPQHGDRMAITEVDVAMEAKVDIEALDSALTRLADIDEQQARIVEMKFFGGMTLEDIAEVLGISTATVTREWRMARAWLRRELDG
jgi:RNA polymerase sigma factor (TIGR02999 family)